MSGGGTPVGISAADNAAINSAASPMTAIAQNMPQALQAYQRFAPQSSPMAHPMNHPYMGSPAQVPQLQPTVTSVPQMNQVLSRLNGGLLGM